MTNQRTTLGPVGLGGVTVSRSQSSDGFNIGVAGGKPVTVPASVLDALALAVTAADDMQAESLLRAVSQSVRDLRKINGRGRYMATQRPEQAEGGDSRAENHPALTGGDTTLGVPGKRTCNVCGDIDQPEYQHFTSDHTDEPDDGQTLIAGVLYDQDGYEAEEP